MHALILAEKGVRDKKGPERPWPGALGTAVLDTGHRRLLSLFKEIPSLEKFFITKSNKSKKFRYKAAFFLFLIRNFFYFEVKNSSNSGNFAALAHARQPKVKLLTAVIRPLTKVSAYSIVRRLFI
jgi:hypothetical protein